MLHIFISFLRALIPLLQTLLANLEQEQLVRTTEALSATGFAPSTPGRRTPDTETEAGPAEPPLSPRVPGRQSSNEKPWRHIDQRCGGYPHTTRTPTVKTCKWCNKAAVSREPIPNDEWPHASRFLRKDGTIW